MSLGIDAFATDAAKTWPDGRAFGCRGETLTFAGLLRRSEALAEALQAKGVAPGDRVGIAMTKGLEMPIAIQGIWRAGAAFVPLDPSAPLKRLHGLAEACGLNVIVGAARDNDFLSRFLPSGDDRLLIAGDLPKEPSEAFRPVSNQPDDLAYIIFTSGSTGAPKGITHTHRSGRAFAEMWARLYKPVPDDVLFCTVPLHFDFSLADFFAAPIGGAMTELVPEAVQLFPASLADLMERSGATIWSTVPYALYQLVERGAIEGRDLSRLRMIIYGGEPISPVKLAQVRRLLGADISNSYGPAEVNQVTEYEVPPDHPVDRAIPIGQPTDHADLAQSEHGELLVSTEAMMRGYWGRDDLDAEVFVRQNGRTWYRTGDVVERAEDGLWRFVGRADRQIKLRGYRIELDEVERAFVAHPDVIEAAVVPTEEKLKLAAFISLRDDANENVAALRTHVAGILPNYAIPAHILIRKELPRTGTGKIDRKKLALDVSR